MDGDQSEERMRNDLFSGSYLSLYCHRLAISVKMSPVNGNVIFLYCHPDNGDYAEDSFCTLKGAVRQIVGEG
jgi:hypothetical protein